MISRFSSYLVSLYFKHTENSENKQYQEVYQYVLFIILNYVFFFGYSLLFGSLLGIPWQSIVFFISIVILRRYAGGYHADTETRCLIITTSYLSVGIVFIKLLCNEIIRINFHYIITTIICALIILMLCPCDSPEKPLEEKQIRVIKIKNTVLVFVLLTLILCLWFSRNQIWSSPFITCFLIETGLIITGKIKLKAKNSCKHIDSYK